MPHAVGVIPARLASTRLPRKLLLARTGRTVLQHTWENALRATTLTDVVVAADGPEIAAAAAAFGAKWVRTGEHPSGTDRIAEVARTSLPHADILVNIQGDEPELDPRHIDLLVRTMAETGAEMATLGTPIRSRAELENSNCVKAAVSEDGRAVYFSRCPVPFVRDADPETLLATDSPWVLHLGVYAYRRDFLLRLAALPPSRLEKLEKLEQLRALEAGATIRLAVVPHRATGIDTAEDYAAFVGRQRRAA